MSDFDLCKICGRKKRQRQAAGSLTQWLFSPDACDCDFLKLKGEQSSSEGESAREQICLTCGKRIASGRLGSLTQWVFRADTCACERARLQVEPGAASSPLLLREFEEAPAFEPTDEALSARLGLPERYSPIRMLGSGSLSRVYKCWDNVLSKPVAVKHLSGLNLTASEILQFQEEAKATSVLSHPSIVRVLDFGSTSRGEPYMVMEYIDGKSLQSLIDEHGPLPERIVARLIMSVCSGMSHAHKQGIYHRDLKVSNIVVPLDGRDDIPIAKVIDFGIAAIHRADGSEEITYQGHKLAGTPGYMSPDQLRGEPYDERSDIYSLGCTMFETLTGRLPFVGRTSLQLLNQHASKEPPTLHDANPDLEFSESLEHLIARTLAKTKEERFQTMLELKEALEHFLEETHQQLLRSAEQYGEAAELPSLKKKGGQTKLWLGAALAVTVIAGGVLATGVVKEGKQPSAIDQVDKDMNPRAEMKEAISTFATNAFGLDGVSKKDEDLKHLDPSTTDLNLVASDITDDGISRIVDLPLESLRVDATRITDKGLEKISRIKTLKILYVGDNPLITGRGLKYLENLPNLRFLSINTARINDHDLKALSDFPSLVNLDLGGTPIQGDGFVYLKELPKLRGMYISGLTFSPAGTDALGQLDKMERLEARNITISERFIKSILRMKDLQFLNLSETNLSDGDLARFSSLTKLSTLRIENCPHLSSLSLTRIAAQLPHCRVLDGRKRSF